MRGSLCIALAVAHGAPLPEGFELVAHGPPCLAAPAVTGPPLRLVVRGWTSHRLASWVAKFAIEARAGQPVELLRSLVSSYRIILSYHPTVSSSYRIVSSYRIIIINS